jgi:hypothetical protein
MLFFAGRSAATDVPPPTFGGELRLRAEGFDNPLDLRSSLDDSYQFYRMRYRLWVDEKPRDGLRLYFRLGGEYRWGVFAGGVQNNRILEAASARDAESRVSLDNGWAELAGPKGTGLSLKFGRMDLPYGEGFLVYEGTPSDGSSSVYFDAVKMTWTKGANTVDLFTAKLQDEGFGTKGKDEDLFGLYGRRGPFELYVLDRDKRGPTTTNSGIVHPAQQTTAIGGRVALLPPAGFYLAAEGAYQLGLYRDRDSLAAEPSSKRRGYGGYARGGINGGQGIHPGLELGGTYLSGDDPRTGRYEGWDGFYSEYPRYSELYLYTLYDNTTRIGIDPSHPVSYDDAGTWTNLAAVWLEGRIKPSPLIKGSMRGTLFYTAETYHSVEKSIGPDPACGCSRDRSRGWVLAGVIDVTPMPDVTGQVLGEFFEPGRFYGPHPDRAWYGRCQLTVRY